VKKSVTGKIFSLRQKPHSVHFGKKAVPLAKTARLVFKAKTTKYAQKAEPFLALPFIF
jgi:hypothetical protein